MEIEDAAAEKIGDAMAGSVSCKMLRLRSSDGEIFEVEETVALQSVTIKNLSEDGLADEVIPLLNVDGKTLAMVMEWCKKHAGEESQMEERRSLDMEVFKAKTDVLFHLAMAADYLDITKLLDLICRKIADRMSGKKTEAIRKMFHIGNDFTTEEDNIASPVSW